MGQTGKCSFSMETDGSVAILQLSGTIDEQTDFDKIFEGLEGTKKLIINLKGVTMINSCGVRDWVNKMKEIGDSFEIEYVECSSAIIEQLNMITNFLSSGKIVSFYAPYYCEDCDKERNKLIVIEEQFPSEEDREEPEAPDFDCPDCGKTMELSEDEDEYFSFLSE